MLQYYMTLVRGYHFLKCKTLGYMEIRVSQIPPVCVVGVGEGVELDPYRSHDLLVWISFRILLHFNFYERNMGQLMTFWNEI